MLIKVKMLMGVHNNMLLIRPKRVFVTFLDQFDQGCVIKKINVAFLKKLYFKATFFKLNTLDSWRTFHNKLFEFQQDCEVVHYSTFAATARIGHIWSQQDSNHFQSSIALQCNPFGFLFRPMQSCFDKA